LKDYLRTAAVIAGAFICSSLLARVSPLLPMVFNLLSVVVVYYAVSRGEVYGAVTGMLCGLMQDSFSLGVFGVSGIAKTLAGYVAGSVSKRINITPWSRRFVFFVLILALELAVWAFLYTPIFSRRINTGGGVLFLEPILTGSAALAVSPLVSLTNRFWKKWRGE